MSGYCKHCMNVIEGTEKICPHCKSDLTAEVPPHRLLPGTLLNGRFYVGEALGEGGFGITYIGFDTNLDMKVAIKEYYPTGYVNRSNTVSAGVREITSKDNGDFFKKGCGSFLKEARTLAQFSGMAGIVDVRDFFEENNTAYIIMEYLDGVTLKERLKSSGTLSAGETVELLTPVMKALIKVHKKGLIHRDISPDNIMIVDGGVKLLDFGAARNVSAADGKSLSVMLKPGYAPEEQYRGKGEQGPWTDVYALCATMYKCITGITPDDAAQRMFSDDVKYPSALGIDISKDIETAIMRGMSVLQKDRFQSVEELMAALNGGAPAMSADSGDSPTVYMERETRSEDDNEDNKATVYMEEQPEAPAPAVVREKRPAEAVKLPEIQPAVRGNPPVKAAKFHKIRHTSSNHLAQTSPQPPAVLAGAAALAILCVVLIASNSRPAATDVSEYPAVAAASSSQAAASSAEPFSPEISQFDGSPAYNFSGGEISVSLGVPDNILNAGEVMSKMTAVPEMFYGKHRLPGGEDAAKALPDKTGYYPGYMTERGDLLSLFPYKIECGPATLRHMISNVREHNWLELYFTTDDKNLYTVRCAYESDGNKIKCYPVDKYEYDAETKTIKYSLSSFCFEYEYQFKGLNIILSKDGQSVTLDSALDSETDGRYIRVNTTASDEENTLENIKKINLWRYSDNDGISNGIRLAIDPDEHYGYAAQMTEKGLFTLTLANKLGEKTLQFAYLYCGDDGLILTDGETTYFYNGAKKDADEYTVVELQD